MSGEKGNIFSLVRRIQKESKDSEDYHTGLLGEHLIVASYKQMPINKLEKIRYIINKLIHKKKEERRISESHKKQNVQSNV